MGTAYAALLPYQTFRTATKDIALAVGSEKLWKAFCPAIGHPELVDHPLYRTNKERTQNFAQLINLLQDIFLEQSYDYWETQLMTHGIPVGAVNDISQLVEHPQVKARGALVDIDHPAAGPTQIVGVPMRLSKTPGSIRTPSPLLGEHTEQVLQSMLGMSAEEVAELRELGALG